MPIEAAALEAVARGAKAYYEDRLNRQGTLIENILFPMRDEDLGSHFLFDRKTTTPVTAKYVAKDAQSHVVTPSKGEGTLYEVPAMREKIPLNAAARNALEAGVEATASYMENNRVKMEQQARDYDERFRMTKAKQALDTVRLGRFEAKSPAGAHLGSVDYNRDPSLDISFDAGTSDLYLLPAAMAKPLVDQGISTMQVVFLAGSAVLAAIAGSDEMNKRMQWVNSSPAVMARVPVSLQGSQELYVVGEMLLDGLTFPALIVGHTSNRPYRESLEGAAGEWIPSNEAMMFSLVSERINVVRGVRVFDGNGSPQQVLGDMAMDAFVENDPIVEWTRAQDAHLFVPANTNHTSRAVVSNL